MEGSVNLSRRGFLRARPLTRRAFRPPWALPEHDFLQSCTRCEKCIEVCPTEVVRRGDGGFPEVSFSHAECTFCGACVKHCLPGALRQGAAADALPWPYRAMIGSTCLAQQDVVCRSCGDACELRAIRFRPRLGAAALPEIEMDVCTGCGACVGPCPAQAIAMTNFQEGAML